jgi:anhydro-N-acetylmuramic acid kinase
MVKLRIIGVMTGNSMDAVDLVLTEFDGDKMRDICSYSEPYDVEQKQQIDDLRRRVATQHLTKQQLVNDRKFIAIHWQYVEGIANAVNAMCDKFGLQKKKIDAIGFHGKTLDHYPPSMAKIHGGKPFTTQMGSAQQLANLTGIPVINDFRSALVQNGFEGAPLAGPHNAHIALIEGNGCYFNAGNTGNLALIKDGVSQISYDVGPFNEYIDQYILLVKGEAMDTDGAYGKKGKLLPELLQKSFDLCREYYELLPPKSGDPNYYHTPELLDYIKQNYASEKFNDVIYTLEYFAAYVAAYGLTQIPENIEMAPRFILFGGGWKNPIVMKTFKELLTKETYILPEHSSLFANLRQRLGKRVEIKYSEFGNYMEARLMADLARYFMEQKTWELPELKGKKLILGQVRFPFTGVVDDFLSAAARGGEN